MLYGCNSEQVKSDVINIYIDNIKDSVTFDNIVEDYKFIELSQENGFVLGDIAQVIIDNNNIYVSSNGVYCYDLKGNPLFKIDSKGHAKSEFIDCTSISIVGGIIYMYDKQTRIIHKYNSSDGSFIENIRVPTVCRDLYRIADLYIIDNLFPSDFYSGDARIITTKDFQKTIGEYINNELYKMPFVDQVTYCNNSVVFANFQGNNLFCFDKYGCVEYIVKCKEALPIPLDVLEEYERSNKQINDIYVYGLSNVYENNTYIIGKFRFGNYFSFVYNKKNNNVIAFKQCNTCDYRFILNSVRGVYQDYFLYVITSDDYDYLKEVYGFGTPLESTHKDYNNQKVLFNHKVKGNPIIALYKYKIM